MLLSQELVREVVDELTKDNREFHISELAAELGKRLNMTIASDTARYQANKLCLDNILDRRRISTKLYVYFKRKHANLSSSLTVRKEETT